jgi:hypothetical protein
MWDIADWQIVTNVSEESAAFRLHGDPEDGGSRFHRRVGNDVSNYTTLYPEVGNIFVYYLFWIFIKEPNIW